MSLRRVPRGLPTAAALLLVFVAVVALPGFPGVTWLRYGWLDVCQQLSPRPRLSAPVVIVEIDETSLQGHGQWPWPRTLLAALLARILDARPAVVGVDLLMPEPDRLNPSALPRLIPTIGPEIAERLAELPSNDSVLASTLDRGPVVLSMAGVQDPSARVPRPRWVPRNRGGEPDRLWRFPGVLRSIEELDRAAAGVGLVNARLDGGAVRHVPMISSVAGTITPALALELFRVAGHADISLEVQDGRTRSIAIGGLVVPTQPDGSVWLRYAGPHDRSVSAADVFAGRVPHEVFERKVVLVGVTAAGLADRRPVPGGTSMNGIEIHAEVVESIFDNALLTLPWWARWVEGAYLFVGGGLLLVVLRTTSPSTATLLFALLVVLGSVTSIAFYHRYSAVLDASAPLAALTLFFGGALGVTLGETERRRRYIRRAFQQYVSSELVARIAEDPDALRFGGELRNATVMFCDIRDFTTFTEENDPHLVVEMLREYLTHMTAIILEEGGTLDKFIGDAVMAEFGTPIAYSDHAARCCRAAVRMVTEVERLGIKWIAEGRQPFRIGIGINTGRMIAGNLGSEQRFDYTVIGDDVNVAARLESLNKEHRTTLPIIISESTYVAAGAAIRAKPLGRAKVKGKAEEVQIFELLGVAET